MSFLANLSRNQKIVRIVLTVFVIVIAITIIFVSTRGTASSGNTRPTPTPTQPTIPKGQFIKITNPTSTNGIMNLAEILVLSSPTATFADAHTSVNLAKTAKVTASSIYSNLPSYYGPSMLNDGNEKDFASTNSADKSPFFLLDFGSVQQIGQIYVVNRQDGVSGRTIGSVVTIYDSAMNAVWTSDVFKGKTGGVSATETMDGYSLYTLTPTSASTSVTGA